MKNHIEEYLLNKIELNQKIPFSEFMNLSLYHPDYGYYTNKSNIFGDQGDFITSPITSSMFGECISNEFINIIRSLKKPSILELGGGDGSLAISIFKYLKKNKSLPDKYIILEISENLINYQKERVKKEFPNDYNIFKWITNLEDININGLVIANEFFDALPTERFRINNSKLETLYIESNNQSFNYIWDESSNDFANELSKAKNNHNIDFSDGYISELNLNNSKWIKAIDKCVDTGVLFVIDYGYASQEYFLHDRSDGTLVCIHKHKSNFDPLSNIGNQDISSFVNFSHLKNLSLNTDLTVSGFLSQSSFLINLNILDIHQSKNYSADEAQIESNKLKNILLPNTMGELFKVLVMQKNIEIELKSTREFNQMHKL
ncbi:MAG: SAM-dependent methyltransferase [Pseudomonadota bacterium]|nr:SAM-dependent methyltransferase [Pseudomonadota bacterium]